MDQPHVDLGANSARCASFALVPARQSQTTVYNPQCNIETDIDGELNNRPIKHAVQRRDSFSHEFDFLTCYIHTVYIPSSHNTPKCIRMDACMHLITVPQDVTQVYTTYDGRRVRTGSNRTSESKDRTKLSFNNFRQDTHTYIHLPQLPRYIPRCASTPLQLADADKLIHRRSAELINSIVYAQRPTLLFVYPTRLSLMYDS